MRLFLEDLQESTLVFKRRVKIRVTICVALEAKINIFVFSFLLVYVTTQV